MSIVRKKRDDFLFIKVPRVFIEAVDMRIISEDISSRAEFLRMLGDKIKPCVNDLKKRGLIKNDTDEVDDFEFIPPQI